LDKNQTKELINSFKLILIGIFFWVIKVRYFTFWLSKYNVLNIVGLEIIGTILIFIGLIIIHRVYPFPHSIAAVILNIIILVINILDFFLFKYKLFRYMQEYTPFIMSLELIIISKLMELGLRYFENSELSKKWRNIDIIIFFGFSIPYYTYTSLNLCGFIRYEIFVFSPKLIILFLPLIITLFSFFIYYIHTLILSLNYLSKKQKETDKK
jgi:hypothetical protein